MLSIHSTPILKGNDLIDLVKSIDMNDNEQSKLKRKMALSILEKIKINSF